MEGRMPASMVWDQKVPEGLNPGHAHFLQN